MHETPFKIWLYYGRRPQYMQLMGVHAGYAGSIENQFSFMIRTFFSLALYLSSPFHPPSLFFLLPFSVHVFPVHLQAQPLVRNMQINLLISCIESLRLSWNTCLATIPAYYHNCYTGSLKSTPVQGQDPSHVSIFKCLHLFIYFSQVDTVL